MERLLFNLTPIDIEVDKKTRKLIGNNEWNYEGLFDDLQGNILKDHGRDYVTLLFLTFKPDVPRSTIRKVIANFAKTWTVTSTNEQLRQAAEYRRWQKQAGNYPTKLFRMFLLTANGYRRLGFVDDKLLPPDPCFRLGMKEQMRWETALRKDWGRALSASTILDFKRVMKEPKTRERHKTERKRYFEERLANNPMDLDSWEPCFRGKDLHREEDLHAMIMLASDHVRPTDRDELHPDALPKQLIEEANTVDQHFQTVADVYREEGITYYDRPDHRMDKGRDDRKPIEHFGFIDGISNPLFLKNDLKRDLRDQKIRAYDKFNPWTPLHFVLAKDPNGNSDAYGSYMVFLKLEQKVHEFNESIRRLKTKLGVPKELAEAFVMGRFKDGTPVTLSSMEGFDPIPNNFNYSAGEADNEGARCPLHAHIRKVNRRDANWDSRIVRRGITYGKRGLSYDEKNDRLTFNDAPRKGVGLLFICFQSDIEKHFGTLVKQWAMENSPRQGVGFDPIIGQIIKGKGKQCWRDRWGGDPNSQEKSLSFPISSPFMKFIRMKGGEYFFAPSINFLKHLATIPARDRQRGRRAKTRAPRGRRFKK